MEKSILINNILNSNQFYTKFQIKENLWVISKLHLGRVLSSSNEVPIEERYTLINSDIEKDHNSEFDKLITSYRLMKLVDGKTIKHKYDGTGYLRKLVKKEQPEDHLDFLENSYFSDYYNEIADEDGTNSYVIYNGIRINKTKEAIAAEVRQGSQFLDVCDISTEEDKFLNGPEFQNKLTFLLLAIKDNKVQIRECQKGFTRKNRKVIFYSSYRPVLTENENYIYYFPYKKHRKKGQEIRTITPCQFNKMEGFDKEFLFKIMFEKINNSKLFDTFKFFNMTSNIPTKLKYSAYKKDLVGFFQEAMPNKRVNGRFIFRLLNELKEGDEPQSSKQSLTHTCLDEIMVVLQYLSVEDFERFRNDFYRNSQETLKRINNTYVDSIRMAKLNDYTEYISIYHSDIRIENYHAHLTRLHRIPKDVIVNTSKRYKNIFKENDDFNFELINDRKRLIQESDEMNHCVYSYWNSINDGHCGIYRIEPKGHSPFTLEVGENNNQLMFVQCQGYNNKRADKEVIQLLYKNINPSAQVDTQNVTDIALF